MGKDFWYGVLVLMTVMFYAGIGHGMDIRYQTQVARLNEEVARYRRALPLEEGDVVFDLQLDHIFGIKKKGDK